MEAAHAGALQLPLETEIEVGRIDADEHRNALVDEAPEERAPKHEKLAAGAR